MDYPRQPPPLVSYANPQQHDPNANKDPDLGLVLQAVDFGIAKQCEDILIKKPELINAKVIFNGLQVDQ